ncbi:YegS/Rv2252/BmrU family lipid kinase [Ilyobacter polytropus]|uniref:Diacylglycerol kinase catalytic region n=1 Tax=Ilyobacter polytropus (strain ATCC 51220 / DSM 2926 / LMG 16218 / CuHBu1) TaxID=572544 RepID=E3HDU0_ILYPC|nr:YegS/Rv2252/BmrU family lipid kinase [Ilyobacter polytropus]ADO84276.1 diacylglycerol kinase catalytic region [Ilyobacter polytropus DSM 2926]
MKRARLIYNPYSGENYIVKHLDTIFKVYQKKGYTIDAFRISYEANIEDAFKDIGGEYNHIIIAGGDGTVNQIINIMKKTGIDLPVAILPTGTANDFATCLGMPKDISEACQQILSSNVKLIDLGKVNDTYFVNVASTGLFTDVSQKTNVNLKNTMGKLAYYFSGIIEIPNFKRLQITVESKELKYTGHSLIIFAFNGKSAGNIDIAYKSQLDDGLLDIVIVKAEIMTETLLSFFKFLKKEHLENPKGVIHFKTNRLSLKCNESISTDLDGEKGPDFPLDIQCIKNGLKILGYAN